MRSFLTKLLPVLFVGTIAAPAQAQETFESFGYVDSVDPIVRHIVVEGETLRIGEGLSVPVNGKPMPALVAIEAGQKVMFSGAVTAAGEKVINSLSIHSPAAGSADLQAPEEQ